MDVNKFWELIETSRKKGKKDLERQTEILVKELSKLSIEEIYQFDNILKRHLIDSYNSELWAAAYIINGGCSDDGFEYFRGWLIAQGRKTYENALNDPQSLAKIVSDDEAGEAEFEDILYVCSDAYSLKTSGTDDFNNNEEQAHYPEIEINWDDDSLETMFPKLVKKFW